jgi:hypothetical protein
VQQGFIINKVFVMYIFCLVIEQHNVELVCTSCSKLEINYETAFRFFLKIAVHLVWQLFDEVYFICV